MKTRNFNAKTQGKQRRKGEEGFNAKAQGKQRRKGEEGFNAKTQGEQRRKGEEGRGDGESLKIADSQWPIANSEGQMAEGFWQENLGAGRFEDRKIEDRKMGTDLKFEIRDFKEALRRIG